MDSCCVCGLILGAEDSDFPQWCKDISALCWFHGLPTLSDRGHIDDEAIPFHLALPGHGFHRFCYRRSLSDEIEGSCYPFHAACLKLLQEIDHGGILLDGGLGALFKVFEGVHYQKNAHVLRWWHDYYLDDISDCSLGDIDRRNFREDINPLRFNIKEYKDLVLPMPPLSRELLSATAMIHSLPQEIFPLILRNLDYSDVLNLQLASATFYKLFRRHAGALPASFWESRFWLYGETGFARSICPPLYSWKEWFFSIKSELKDGPNRMNLRNRRRIWKLAVHLIDVVCTIKEPNHNLEGDLPLLVHNQMPGYAASCLARKYDSEGCRELTQRFARLSKGARLCSISLSYIALLDRRFISGFELHFNDRKSISVGYIATRRREHLRFTVSPKILWLVSSQLGFEAVAFDVYPQRFLDSFIPKHGTKIAIARWTLENIKGICLGLDALRIVRVCLDVYKQDKIDGILWLPPRPSAVPCIHNDDIAALHKMQSESFAPASAHLMDPDEGSLVTIKIYSSLGRAAGITGIGFVYNTGTESRWGSVEDTAALSFYLDGRELLVKIKVYKIDSLVCHLQFTTSLHRTSNLFPQIPTNTNISFERVEYEASENGHIAGFCGCFAGSSNQLCCIGVISTAAVVTSKLAPQTYASRSSFGSQLELMPLGGIRNHGQYLSRIMIGKKYKSVQASFNPAQSKYRRAGQVTGLLFRSSDDPGHPDLLGQWTGTGTAYDFDEDERITDLEFTTAAPVCKQRARPGLSQVQGVTMVTNRRRLEWSSGASMVWELESSGLEKSKKNATEIVWEFNAIFDRILCK